MSQAEDLLFILKLRDEASAILKKNGEQAKQTAQAYGDAARQSGMLQRALSLASGGATSFGGALRNVSAGLMSLGAPTAAGVVGARTLEEAFKAVVAVFKEMVENTVAYEKSQKALGGAMRVTAGAVGMTTGEVNDVVMGVSEKSRMDDTDVRNAAAELIVSGRTTREVFKDAMDVSLQLSRVMATDIVSATQLVSRAMADPARGMDELRRAGVGLTAVEKERIRIMEASSGRTAAQGELLALLAARVGGASGSAAGPSLSGAFKQASFAWSQFLDQFNDSMLSRATAGVVELTAAVIKFFTVFKDRSNQERIDARKAMIAALESDLAILERKTVPSGGDKKLIGDLKAQIAGLRKELADMAAEAAAAIQKGVIDKMKEANNVTQQYLLNSGLSPNDAGTWVETSVVEADKKLDAANRHLQDALKFRATAIAEFRAGIKTRADLDEADAYVRDAQVARDRAADNARKAGEMRSADVEFEKQRKIARMAQADREAAQKGIEAYERARRAGQPEGQARAAEQQAIARARELQALKFADQNAATSREVQYQIELADAYMKSTQAANELIAKQKAMEARATGSGNPDPVDLQNLEFFRGLAAMHAEIAKSAEEIPDLEVQAVMAVDATAAYTYDVYRDTYAKVRDLRAKMIKGGDLEEAQKIKLEEAKQKSFTEADRKALATLSVDQARNVGRLKDETDLMKLKIGLAGRSQVEEDKAIARFEAARERRKAEGRLYASEEEQKRAVDWIDKNEAARIKFADVSEAARRASGPLAAYQRDAAEGWKAYESGIVSALNATDEALTGILFRTRDWQTAMGDLLRSVVQDFAKIAIHQNITAPLANAVFGAGLSGAGGGGGGLIGRAFGWLTSLFAGGGIMTAHGPLPLRRYAQGGIATAPQLALFGEGSTPEAYVPVPNGRIPVTLNGRGGFGGGHAITTNIAVNVTGGGGGGGRAGAGAGGGDPAAMASEIGALVTAAFNRNLTEQMRPGGILNPAGSYNPAKVM